MIRKLLPVLLALVAFLGGAAAGDMLGGSKTGPGAADANEASHAEAGADPAETAAPAPAHEAGAPAASAAAAPAHGAADKGGHGTGEGDGTGGDHTGGVAWFKFPQQFFVPVLHDGRLDSTMILSLSLETPQAALESVNAHELKLRDGLLRQLLIHANTGGFDGNFTAEPHLRALRAELMASAQAVVPEVTGILIEDIARQER